MNLGTDRIIEADAIDQSSGDQAIIKSLQRYKSLTAGEPKMALNPKKAVQVAHIGAVTEAGPKVSAMIVLKAKNIIAKIEIRVRLRSKAFKNLQRAITGMRRLDKSNEFKKRGNPERNLLERIMLMPRPGREEGSLR